MKVLSKRILRELKTHFGRYAALFVMIALGMYLVVSIAGMAEMTIKGSDKYNKACNLQDGQFTTTVPLDNKQIDELEKEYGKIEKIFSFDMEVSNKVLRIFKVRKDIDKINLDKGTLPKENTEAVLMNLYALKNDIHINDKIQLSDKEIKVCGLGCVPDYNLPVKNFSDMTADPKNFGVAFVSDKTYELLRDSRISGSESYTYAYKLKEGRKHNDLKDRIKESKVDKDMADIPLLESFYENQDNPRIASDAASDVILKRMVSLVAGAILVMLFAYVISVFIIHQINEESSVIGTLYACGIKRVTLIVHYILLPTAVTFIAGLVGLGLGFSKIGVDYQMLDSYLYYSIPQMDKVYPLYIILYCIVMPPVIATVVNIIVIRKKLSKTALSLIKNEQEGLLKKGKNITSINDGKANKKKRENFIKEFMIRQLSREKRSVITVVMGMMVALLILMIGIDCYVLCSNVKKENMEDVNYEYMYLLKSPIEEVPKDGEGCFIKDLSMNYLDYSLDVNIIGIDNDNPYYNYKTSGNKKDIVIASSTAQKYNLKVGDEFVLEDTSEDIKYAFNVSDIVDYSIGLTAYMDINEMRELFGVDENYINMIVSDKKLDIDNERIWSITKRSDIEHAAGIFVDQMMSLIVILIVVSILILIAVMYLMLNVMIDRAAFGISLVKIFGYRMREIRKIYLDGNFYIVLLGTLIGAPIVKKIADSIYPYFIANTAMGMNLKFTVSHYLLVIGGVILIYIIISSILTGKIKRITPADVLKNRE